MDFILNLWVELGAWFGGVLAGWGLAPWAIDLVANIIGVVMQLTITGKWGELASDLSSLKLPFGSGGTPPPSDTVAQIAEGEEAEEGKKEPKDAKRRKRSRGRRKKR